jgi:Ca2+-binding RTX toxin-like protein
MMSAKLGKSTVATKGDATSDILEFNTGVRALDVKTLDEKAFDVAPFDGFSTEHMWGGDAVKFPELPSVGLLVTGTERDDTLYGSDLADQINGLGGADRLDGGRGDDLLFGGDGNDTLLGGSGNDLLFGGLGDDAISGGAGVDTVSYANQTAGIYVDMSGHVVQTLYLDNEEHDHDTDGDGDHDSDDHTPPMLETDTLSSIERVIGSDHDDLFIAYEGSVYFDGGNGNDTLMGGVTGVSVLVGGAGDDELIAVGTAAWMTGGDGADEFRYSFAAPSTITDFESGIDTIWDVATAFQDDLPFGYDGILATGTAVPTMGTADHDALFYDTDDYALYELWYNADGHADATLLATFTNGVQLQTSDFTMV